MIQNLNPPRLQPSGDHCKGIVASADCHLSLKRPCEAGERCTTAAPESTARILCEEPVRGFSTARGATAPSPSSAPAGGPHAGLTSPAHGDARGGALSPPARLQSRRARRLRLGCCPGGVLPAAGTPPRPRRVHAAAFPSLYMLRIGGLQRPKPRRYSPMLTCQRAHSNTERAAL